MAITIRQSLGGGNLRMLCLMISLGCSLYTFSLYQQREVSIQRDDSLWNISRIGLFLDVKFIRSLILHHLPQSHNPIFTSTCKILLIRTKFHCQNWTIMRLDILPHIKITKALNDYKPIEEEWSIHAKNYSNIEKQKWPYLAEILQAEEQSQRQMQNSNDMINIG